MLALDSIKTEDRTNNPDELSRDSENRWRGTYDEWSYLSRGWLHNELLPLGRAGQLVPGWLHLALS